MRKLMVLISLNQPNNIIVIKSFLPDINILDDSCAVASYISLKHYSSIPKPLFFRCFIKIVYMYSERLRDPYISFTALFFFARCCFVVVAKHQEVCSSSILLRAYIHTFCMYNLFIYT